MKSSAMPTPTPNVKLSDAQWNQIIRDIHSGVTADTIKKKYSLNSWQYKQVRNYVLSPSNPAEAKREVIYRHLEGQAKKTGATRQGRNDVCLCGSGKKYKHCCGK